MIEVIVNNLSAILFGLAALVSAMAAFVSVWFNRNRLIEAGTKLDAVDKKVDGGIARLQEALAEVAKIAASTGKTVVVQGQRSTDPRVEIAKDVNEKVTLSKNGEENGKDDKKS